MSNILYETDKYYVMVIPNAMGEDNKATHVGYGVVNKETDVVEHTTIMLPGAIFQAQHFSDTLTQLLSSDKPDNILSLAELPTEDVVPN